jgi:hypothetical protein
MRVCSVKRFVPQKIISITNPLSLSTIVKLDVMFLCSLSIICKNLHFLSVATTIQQKNILIK